MRFRTKTGPKNGLILTKLGVYNHHTSNQKRTKFYWNRIIFDFQNQKIKNKKLSDFNKIWCVFGLKCGDCTHQVSSKSDHFLARFWSWIANKRYSYPKNLIFFITHRSMKMGQVWKKSVTTIMELILLCTVKFRVWIHAHMGKLRPKIWCTVYYLPKRSHGVKFKQNPRNCPSGRSYDLENLSVNLKKNSSNQWLLYFYDEQVLEIQKNSSKRRIFNFWYQFLPEGEFQYPISIPYFNTSQ